jgi:hypothetical protein
LNPWFEGFNALARGRGVRRIRIQLQHFIVINQRAIPLFALFVKSRNLKIAAHLFGLEHRYGFLRLRPAPVVGKKRDEISERRNRLRGGVLIVFGRYETPSRNNASAAMVG